MSKVVCSVCRKPFDTGNEPAETFLDFQGNIECDDCYYDKSDDDVDFEEE